MSPEMPSKSLGTFENGPYSSAEVRVNHDQTVLEEQSMFGQKQLGSTNALHLRTDPFGLLVLTNDECP